MGKNSNLPDIRIRQSVCRIIQNPDPARKIKSGPTLPRISFAKGRLLTTECMTLDQNIRSCLRDRLTWVWFVAEFDVEVKAWKRFWWKARPEGKRLQTKFSMPVRHSMSSRLVKPASIIQLMMTQIFVALSMGSSQSCL